jgi:hypothetical protein
MPWEVIAAIYVLACIVAGIAGMYRSMGFWGGFFISLLLPPVGPFIVIFILVLTRRGERYRPPGRSP